MARTLLIVDDIRSNREILKNILGGEYEFAEAASGEEALRILLESYDRISTVLLDVSMPGLSGYEVLQKMRSNAALASVPVIMITGSENEEARVKALSYGANDFVMKPYSSEVIRHCLRNNIALYEAKATVDSLRRDSVTGLYNREAFFEQVKQAVAGHAPGYYIMARFDIDKFKVINDQYGTEKGDAVLRHVAETFTGGFETHGGICCRVSADNFAVLYPSSFQNSDELAAIRQAASHVEGLIFPLVFTIGRYVVDDVSLSPSAMYDRAAIAAGTAKGRYDNKIAVYSEKMRAQLIRDQKIVTEMAVALQDRQFEVWFQPQYNHATGARIGAEALVRWRHPEHGLIVPNHFIPVFEQNGFIYELDKYVWDAVCRHLRKWTDEGRNPLPVSVNISRHDVLRPDLIETITKLVSAYDLPRDLLRLEVTESAFSQSTQQIVSVVKELIDLGFTVEIDDFGSGYSSLNTLKEVPAQILKLDMRFFDSHGDTQRGGSIVESVVRMAKWLDMSVIAEGVEKKEQADYLRSIGYNYIQGYYYAKPMPAEEYEAHCKGVDKEERMLAIETVEHLDNDAFWDAGSLDSLIFNSFVGAACIFEFGDDGIEAIRATDKFAEMIGGGSMSVEDALKLDWGRYLDADNQKLFRDAVLRSKKTNADATVELTFAGLPGCPEKTYSRSTMRVIATVGNRFVVYCLVENVTARREAEQKMREAASEIQMMMDDTPGGFARLRLNPDGTLSTVYVNEAFCQMRGMTAEEIMAADSEDATVAIHPDDKEAALAVLEEMVDTGAKRHAVYRVQRSDGSYIPLNAYGRITRNESGQLFDSIFYSELSEQEKKDLSIREMTPFVLSAIMQSSSDLAFAKDKHFRYICCSPGFVRFTGRNTEADVVGKTDYELWSKDVADQFRSDDLRLFENGQSLINYTEPIPSDDGVQHYSVTSKYILRDSTGEIIGLYGLGRDVTDTRTALDRLQLLTDSIPGGIATYVITPDGIQTTYFNDGLCKMLGCSREEYENQARQSVYARVFPEDLPDFIAQVTALYQNGTPIDGIFRSRRIHGDGYVWVNLKGTLAERHGDTVYVNAVLYDVTKLHEAEIKEQEMAHRTELIMNNVGAGIRAITMDGDKANYLFTNDRFFELLGYTREQYTAEVKDIYDPAHPDDRAWVKSELQSTMNVGDRKRLEFRIITRDGRVRWLRAMVSVTAFSGSDTPVQLCVYTDITNIVEAHEREAQSQRLLLDNLPYGAALYEYDGTTLKVLHLNKKYWELMDRKPREYSDLSFMNAVHPDDRLQIAGSLHTAISQRQPLGMNLRLLYGESKYRLFHVTANLEQQEDGKYLVYAAYDPVDPDALSYQQALPLVLSAIMNSTNDFAFAKDKDFRYISASSAFLRLAGLENENDAIGKTDFDLFPADMAEAFRKNDLYLIESGESLVDFDETIHAPDGTTHYCRASKHPLRDTAGQIVGLYGISRDISRERDALTQLRLVNDSVPGGIATYTVKNGALRISYCNDGFCKLFGGTLEGFAKRGDFDPVDWIVDEDRPELLRQVDALVKDSTPMDAVYRVYTVDGDVKWVNQKATVAERYGDTVTFNSLLLDITERQNINEQLRISEEENALAVRHSGNTVCRFHIAEKTLIRGEATGLLQAAPPVIYDVPDDPVRRGVISPETADAFIGFFEAICKGNKAGTVLYQQKFQGEWRWTEAKSSTVFAADGTPVKAVISMYDVTDRIEKENIYRKWQQSLDDRAPESYTLFRTNISSISTYDAKEGALLTFDFNKAGTDPAEAAKAYATNCIYAEDRDKYIAFVNVDAMLASYYRGKRSDSIEYRELLPDGNVHWLRLTVDLVEFPNSTDVEAYMMFEDIDEAKKAELKTQALSETDPLTGILNRTTFIARVDQILRTSKPETKHALLMLDIDGFKQVNDAFGHAAGDQALIEIAERLRTVIRAGDLVARLGGDEFVVFLTNVMDAGSVIEKAKQMRSLVHKSFSMEVQISGSIGIALSPYDGMSFETLYKKADSALYYVKGSGRDDEAIYSEDMADQHLKPEQDTVDGSGKKPAEKKRRMLIVDDSSIDHAFMQNLFKDQFIIEKAKDGNTALIRLRHYGSAISVVLLDLMMPGMDGFAVLEKMQESAELRAIPVIMVSGDESRETCLTAIRKGATDFVTKPVDVNVLRIRVQSAISKAENERLRAKNSLLEYQNSEVERYKDAMENSGMVVIENNWITGAFLYDPSISEHIAGKYDSRGLWQILLSDFVAETVTVQKMHELVQKIATTRERQTAQIVVRLKTPEGKYHQFRMRIKKKTNEFGLAVKMYMSFIDLDTDPADA